MNRQNLSDPNGHKVIDDLYWMERALMIAQKGASLGEVPVGAVIVQEHQLISEAHNTRELLNDPLGHAELNAIRAATLKLQKWRLNDCTLYVTLEPCIMCSGAIVQSRIQRVVYAAFDPKGGAVHSLYQILSDDRLNHRPQVEFGLLQNDASTLLKSFFTQLRQSSKLKK